MHDLWIKFWTKSLETAVAKLVGADWVRVQTTVLDLMDVSITGTEKRAIALRQLRDLGSTVATWLLGAAIDIAYGQLQSRLPR